MTQSSSEIAIIIEFEVAAENSAFFLERLKENSAATLNDDGCLRMEISQSASGDGRIFWLSERWQDAASIEKHRQQPGHEKQHERIDELVVNKRVMRGPVIFG